MKRQSSDGTTGEKMFLYWANVHGWNMIRTQPETKIVYKNGKPTMIFCKRSDGVPDFTGYRLLYSPMPVYAACEVKECSGDIMHASRLSIEQRKFMLKLHSMCSFVGVWWSDYGEMEVFNFVYTGKYVRGKGTK